MATFNQIIDRVDKVKANAYGKEEKARWIAELDGMISKVVMQFEEPFVYQFPEDMDMEPLVREPWDRIYDLYVEAMIDYHNKEYSAYNNSMTMFNSKFEEFKKAYIRDNKPKGAGTFKNL